MQNEELLREQEYTRRVQQRLLALIEESTGRSDSHAQSIKEILADAWDELRLRPTAISAMELEQLAVDVDRYTARKAFAEKLAERARSVLDTPFFARVDFQEDGEDGAERVVIGLYSLSDTDGSLLVHDWRAPVASLYYDSQPGRASYDCLDGTVSGRLTLKRQYRMEKGVLRFYVDTDVTIDDGLLLDVLGKESSRQMHQIVSTIQEEQSKAVRAEQVDAAAVIGAAGSGKTSVALHRAAYLLYRCRDKLDAKNLRILSPTTAFGEYIANVLPELGEEAIQSVTLYGIVQEILGKRVEPPARQQQRLLVEDPELRRASVAYKCSDSFPEKLRACAEVFQKEGPKLADIPLEGGVFVSKADLERMLAQTPAWLSLSERLGRVRSALEKRVTALEDRLAPEYEPSFSANFSGKRLREMCRLSAARRLQPLRAALDDMLTLKGDALLARCLEDAPEALRSAYRQNRAQGVTWWEDAVAEAYLALLTGCAKPDKRTAHLLIDEAQDYSACALTLLREYYPKAKVTLLGDPMQRTCPGMPPCDPARWGEWFRAKTFAVYRLSRCYRTTAEIAALLNRILPEDARLTPFGRHGAQPVTAPYRFETVKQTLDAYRAAGYKSIAVITRTQDQANDLAARLDDVYRFDGGSADLRYEVTDNVVSNYHLTKGMEFDAAIVVWEDVPLDDEEKRRLYTACSRALHALTLLGAPEVS